ncbi:MAG: fumarate hydratase, partial [Clostridia bacterium]|nr:fumarate hydratase [Clostridia bacterium]
MKTVDYRNIVNVVAGLCRQANIYLPEDISEAIAKAQKKEGSPRALSVFKTIKDNQKIAAEKNWPLCQDTGTAVVFLRMGTEVKVEGGFIYDAINEGVAQGYSEHYLRKSIVAHPWLRTNTGDNTPAVIHTELVPGDELKITLMPKGGGAENVSRLLMMKPADGVDGIKNAVLDCVRSAGGSSCPPLVIGIGVGGNFETVPLLAKRALLRPLGQYHSEPSVREQENSLFSAVNQLGIGAMGYGGDITCLWLAMEV